jgi:hypothetical protein
LSHENISTKGEETLGKTDSIQRLNHMSNGIDHKNLNEAKETNSKESSARDGERPTKATSFLIKVVWFFIFWGTLHWIVS